MSDMTFCVGDVFVSGDSRWRVERVFSDGRAVLRSERTEWAVTRPLTWAENADGGFVRIDPEKEPHDE
jgi:hypothetical protein